MTLQRGNDIIYSLRRSGNEETIGDRSADHKKDPILNQKYQVKRSVVQSSKHKSKPVRRFQKENEVSASFWYEIDGFRGCEMPTLFQYCVLSLRDYGEINISIRKDIDVESKIHDFERHWRLENYSRRFEVSTDEWQIIFDSVRNARRF
jgi:hypothetical protein